MIWVENHPNGKVVTNTDINEIYTYLLCLA